MVVCGCPSPRRRRVTVNEIMKVLTLFAFSSENWSRPAKEVQRLMELFMRSLKKETPELTEDEIIEETHPLNKTPLEKVFPILKPFVGCCKKKSEDEF